MPIKREIVPFHQRLYGGGKMRSVPAIHYKHKRYARPRGGAIEKPAIVSEYRDAKKSMNGAPADVAAKLRQALKSFSLQKGGAIGVI